MAISHGNGFLGCVLETKEPEGWREPKPISLLLDLSDPSSIDTLVDYIRKFI